MNGPHLLIGTYTAALPHVVGRAAGILAAPISPAGQLAGEPALQAAARNPSYLTATLDGAHVYAVDESDEGALTAFTADAAGLTVLNTVSSGGSAPCHVALSPDERFVLVTHYGSGSVSVHARAEDGSLGELTANSRHPGAAPHAHMICFDPVTGAVLVPDLGIDAVLIHRLGSGGELTAIGRIDLPAGAGPRHAVFHADGDHLYIVNEFHNTVVALHRRGADFEPIATVSTVPADESIHSQAAAIRITANQLFVSNRGHDSIAMFALDPVPSLVSVQPSGGRTPRDMIVTTDGEHLLVANQDSDTVTRFAIEADTLRPVATHPAPTPVCLTILGG